MPKKDVNDAILGMLSTAGSSTRPAPSAVKEPADVDPAPTASIAASSPEYDAPRQQQVAVPAESPTSGPSAPRTLRLRPTTAQELRDAWLEAKRDDVLLTAQDFASDLVDEMLKVRRRRAKTAS